MSLGTNQASTAILALDYPGWMRVGDAEPIGLAIAVPSDNVPSAPSPGAVESGGSAGGQRLIEASLDLPLAYVLPAASISQALVPAQDLDFRWSVRFAEPGDFSGTAWLVVGQADAVSPPDSRRAISAQPIEIHVSEFLGLRGSAARLLGAVGFLVGIVISTSLFDTTLGAGKMKVVRKV